MHGNTTLQANERIHECARMPVANDDNGRPFEFDFEHDRKLLVGADTLAWMIECDASTVRRWSRTGVMPEPMKVGGRTLWDAERIRDWIRNGCPACNGTQS